jgi:hypothetical protein
MKIIFPRLGALLALGLLTANVQGAQIFSESFASSSAAPLSSLSFGAGAWTYTGGAARVRFAKTDPFALPDVATLRPASGSFTGNYAAAGIGVIGFRFRAEAQLPSNLYLEWAGGSSVYQKVFTVHPSGGWQTFMASLASLEEGGWTVIHGTQEGFADALQSVTSVAIKITRTGSTAREYAIDDLFVDAQPQAAGGVSSDGNEFNLAWDALQPGLPYTIQESPSLNGPWKDADTVTATSRLQQFSIPTSGSASQAFFRLRGP